MELSPSFHQTQLSSWKISRDQINGVKAKYGGIVLIIGMEMRCMVRSAGFHIHSYDDPKKSAKFRHHYILL